MNDKQFSKQDILNAIEQARIDDMFIEWNHLNLMDIEGFKKILGLSNE